MKAYYSEANVHRKEKGGAWTCKKAQKGHKAFPIWLFRDIWLAGQLINFPLNFLYVSLRICHAMKTGHQTFIWQKMALLQIQSK